MNIIDKLLETLCYIVDFLPKQVPMNCGGQFFEVETYLLNHYDCCGLRDRFVGVILKAMCYYPVSVQWGKWIEQPTPEQVTKIIDTILESHSGDVNILFTSKDVLLQFGWDCLNINIYNPDEEMCMLFEKIAASEGLFWWKSEQQLPVWRIEKIVKERIEGGANEKAVLRLFINCPFVCINFDFFWLNKARQLYMDF